MKLPAPGLPCELERVVSLDATRYNLTEDEQSLMLGILCRVNEARLNEEGPRPTAEEVLGELRRLPRRELRRTLLTNWINLFVSKELAFHLRQATWGAE